MGLLINRAKASCNAAGTGAVTPGAAVAPYRTWSASGAAAAFWYDYLIEQGNAWESGVGLYNGTTITRGGPGVDPWFDSSTGSLLNLNGSETIACVANKDTLAAGSPFMPPLAVSFAGESGNATSLSLTDDHAAGLKVALAGAGTSNILVCAFRTLTTPSGDWVMTAKLNWVMAPNNFQFFGLYAHDTGGGRVISWGPRSDAQYDAVFWNSLSSFNADNLVAARGFPTWFRLEKAGTLINYRIGMDNYSYHQFFAGSALSSFINNPPQRVGLFMQSQAGIPLEFSVPYFSLTGTAV